MADMEDAAGRTFSLRELLCIPYRVEASTTETSSGQWVRRATYPELPGCTAEAPTIEEALNQLERRRVEIIIATVQGGGVPPVPRPPLGGIDPAGVAAALGVAAPPGLDDRSET